LAVIGIAVDLIFGTAVFVDPPELGCRQGAAIFPLEPLVDDLSSAVRLTWERLENIILIEFVVARPIKLFPESDKIRSCYFVDTEDRPTACVHFGFPEKKERWTNTALSAPAKGQYRTALASAPFGARLKVLLLYFRAFRLSLAVSREAVS
jgi:hypothetical protein